MSTSIRRTFASFGVRNFRLYYFGQGISLCGTWMQTIALSWLVLKLTHSGTQLGLVVAAQFLPILLFGVWGGLAADRFNKRRVLYFTQSASGILALLLGLLVVTGAVHLWMVYVIAACLGLVLVIDNPTRQTFVVEMVGRANLKNAITLNSTEVNAARVIGPSIAGILIAGIGVGPCFIVNAASYVAVLIALALMRHNELHPEPRVGREPGQIRAGMRYVLSQPGLRAILLMMFIIGTFAYEFPVILPLLATKTFHGGASTYSAMTAAMGLGAIFGGLYTAGRSSTRLKQVVSVAFLFGIGLLILALMPGIVSALIVLILVGALSVLFIAMGNTTLQLSTLPEMRGRVMSLWAIAFAGTTPVGGPIIGYVADHANPRTGLMVAGVATLIAAGLGLRAGQETVKT